jgi:putative membrane protein (TIGR04086 family)
MMPRLDRASVVRGMVVTLAITVPPAIVVQLMDDDGEMAGSNWARLAFLIILVGFATGGSVAARRQPSAPMAHGAAAAFAAWAVVQGLGIVRRLITGDPLEWLGFVFFGLLAASTGAVGGLIADRIRFRRVGTAAAEETVDP